MSQALAEPSDDVLYEVVKGVRVEKPMGLVENRIATVLIGRLEPFCRNHQLGHAAMETLFAIPNSGNDRKPDVAFISSTAGRRTGRCRVSTPGRSRPTSRWRSSARRTRRST